eukprot:gene1837-biopygen1840
MGVGGPVAQRHVGHVGPVRGQGAREGETRPPAPPARARPAAIPSLYPTVWCVIRVRPTTRARASCAGPARAPLPLLPSHTQDAAPPTSPRAARCRPSRAGPPPGTRAGPTAARGGSTRSTRPGTSCQG